MAEEEAITISLDHVGEAGTGGEYRFRDTQGFRRPTSLIEETVKEVVVKATLLHVVRGTLDSSGSPATLLCFKFSFHSKARPPSKASIFVTFEDSLGPSEADPVVDAISADGQFALNAQIDSQNVTAGFNAGLSGSAVGVGGQIGGHYSVERKESKKHSAALYGCKRRVKRYGDETAAMWDLEEDPVTKEGIPNSLNVAVVVCHELSDRFQFLVEIDTEHKGFLFHGKRVSKMITPQQISVQDIAEDTENLGAEDLMERRYFDVNTVLDL